jgi:hypothetical protein
LSADAKVTYILGLFVDGDVSATTRSALLSYAATATTEQRMRSLFNLVLALPSFQLN